MNYEINPTAPRCNAVRCFAYWDGKCSALTDSHFKAGCPFFKDKEQKELEEIIKADTNRITMRFAAIQLSTWSLFGLYILSEYSGRIFLCKFQRNKVCHFCLCAFENIGVDIRRYAYVAMSEVFRYDFQVNAAVQK